MCLLVFSVLLYGCDTYDPVPPTLEIYQMGSTDAPNSTLNLIAERSKGAEPYKSLPYIKFRDSNGCVWLIHLFSEDPDHWAAYQLVDGQIREVPIVISQEYKNISFGQLGKIIYSDLIAGKEE